MEGLVAFCGAAVLISTAPGPTTVVILREAALPGRAGVRRALERVSGVVLVGSGAWPAAGGR
ncbi:hypothetical protein [Thermomonospora cellulosilytica]|uniref:Threonine/homoserine/homoserine lactone efflux protein n=1 Tax=Thermomonospora cellulosilytica TaxID=1411118 RepID=A0A7W3N1I0_9ACTN|nr:hypothetical protein [Thermomonospora cellulosilytica]MBA9005787.1 threonine/homoserine/homoserine lactone efflux protein [Thermomonospora cellulosilytica]